jgi:hypothetical protein
MPARANIRCRADRSDISNKSREFIGLSDKVGTM